MTMKIDLADDGTEIITPTFDILDVPIGVENLKCSVKGCGRVVSNSSALRMHLLKAHGIGEPLQEEKSRKKLYACPVQGCPRNFESARKKFFKVMYLLKRHYQLTHAEKKHPCGKCGKKFGTASGAIRHEETCRKFFYCSCGVNYTTKNSLKLHLQTHDGSHHPVPDPEDELQEEGEIMKEQETNSNNGKMKTMTIPCFLYIPKNNLSSFQQEKPKEQSFTHTASLQTNERYIRILPKKKTTENKSKFCTKLPEPNQLADYCNSLKGPKFTAIDFQQQLQNQIQSLNSDVCTARYNNGGLVLNSGKACRKILPKTARDSSSTSTQNLTSNFTQTPNPLFPTTQQVDTAMQTCNAGYGYSTLEVLETSDFSTQCQLNELQPGVFDNHEFPVDNQTQTDDLNTLLAHLQNDTNFTDMETQTNVTTLENEIGLDKSVQLDDILSGKTWDIESSSIYITNKKAKHVPTLFMSNKNFECKQTTSTQTFDDIQFEIVSSSKHTSKIDDKDIILPSEFCSDEPLSMSFGTQTGFDDLDGSDDVLNCSSNSQEMLSFGTQTGLENLFSSSSTQTWDTDETSINAKTIETQTTISFSDLLDSSFIDEYLNTDRIMSTQTQTYQNDLELSKTFATTETQTR